MTYIRLVKTELINCFTIELYILSREKKINV